jgi:hypothetical protein
MTCFAYHTINCTLKAEVFFDMTPNSQPFQDYADDAGIRLLRSVVIKGAPKWMAAGLQAPTPTPANPENRRIKVTDFVDMMI